MTAGISPATTGAPAPGASAPLVHAPIASMPIASAPDAARLARVPAPRQGPVRQAATFAVIGLVSTLAYVAAFALLRTAWPAAVANTLALILTAVGNTAANRRLTFDVQGRDGLARDHAAGLVALRVALAITSAALAALDLVIPRAGRTVEIAVLVVAMALATTVRFLLLRHALDATRQRRAETAHVAARTHLERTLR